MNIKENKAITLIALVVTIIILIILAGISLNLVLGEHGIITLAKKAKENMELAQIQEQEELNQLYEQLYNGNEGSSGGSKLPDQEIKEDNYGEYVDYGLDINGNEDTTDDWKIFYTNDGGRIFLIAADYVPTTCKALQTAMDASHANMSKSGNYKCYWNSNSSVTYRCNDGHNKTLNQSKAQCSFPELFMPSTEFCLSHYYCSDHVKSENINSLCASTLQCIENWSSFVTNSEKSECAEYAIGGPTIEMWVASWNKVHGTDTETEGKAGQTLYANGDMKAESGYYVGTAADCRTTTYDLSNFEGYNDPLYFPDKTESKCKAYWLASPSGSNKTCLMFVNWNGKLDNWFTSSSFYGVRPVVCLKSGVKLVKSTDKSTDTKTVYDLYSNNGNSGSSGNTGGSSGTETSNPPTTIPKIEDLKKEKNHYFTEDTTLEDSNGNHVVIPAGFKIAEDSGNNVTEGIVIEDKDIKEGIGQGRGNQYVWIPVSNIDGSESNPIKKSDGTEVVITLGRYTFTSDAKEHLIQKAERYADSTVIGSSFLELQNYRQGVQNNDKTGLNRTAKDLIGFINSVKENKGYYIARYEASYGLDQKPDSKISIGFYNMSEDVIVTQEGYLWNNIIQIEAAEACDNMYKTVKSDLVNSYAWDTAIVYIQKFSDDIDYSMQDGYSINSNLANTGVNNDEVCKINDLASNCMEWTTEYSSFIGGSHAHPCVHRGGCFSDEEAYPAQRGGDSSKTSYGNETFRSILYINIP